MSTRPRRGNRVRVLVVDDSALIRRLLTDLLKSAPEIEVVGTARDGREAVLEATRLRPDVITLDVEMPEVSGLDALPLLLALGGIEVVMVSALTQEGADVTLQALELGAFDSWASPRRTSSPSCAPAETCWSARFWRPLRAAGAMVARRTSSGAALGAATPSSRSPPSNRSENRRSVPPTSATPPPASSTAADSLCVVIGISTGGPQALSQIFPRLHSPLPPIVVVQHMPAQFTGVFAARLDRYSSVTVKHAEEGDCTGSRPRADCSRRHALGAQRNAPARSRRALGDPPVSGHRPSVDVLFRSAAKVYGRAAVGLLMTGMGRDGVDGCKAILAAGGLTLGQDEDSSVVYGMNKAAYLEGAVKAQFALDEVSEIIQNIVAFRAVAWKRTLPSARGRRCAAAQ